MNTLLIIGLLTIYLITCVGYFKNLTKDSDFMSRMEEFSTTAVYLALFLCAMVWPVVTVGVLLFKGLSK